MNRRVLEVAAFTLVELLVSLSIIAVLAGLLVPAAQSSREASRRSACHNNARQLAVAALCHESHRGQLPVGALSQRLKGAPALTAGTSWWTTILPHIEEANIFNRLDLKSKHSGFILMHPSHGSVIDGFSPEWMFCPSSPLERQISVGGNRVAMPSYVGISGATSANGFGEDRVNRCCLPPNNGEISAGGALIPNMAIRIAQILDGSSHTWIFGETSDYAYDSQGTPFRIDGGHSLSWLMGTKAEKTPPFYEEALPSWNLVSIQHPPNLRDYYAAGVYTDHGPNNPLTSAHPSGVTVAMVDASTKFVSNDVDVTVMMQYATRDDAQRERPTTDLSRN